MSNARAVLLLLFVSALPGAMLHAQDEVAPAPVTSGNVSIRYVVDDQQETFWESWREGDDGPFVLALPYAIEMSYSDRTAPDAAGNALERKLLLLADRALIWFNPGDGDQEAEDVQNDPFLAMGRGIRNLQFYGEGNIWMRYRVGGEAVTLRADRVFLDFSRSRIITYNSKGDPEFTEALNLEGRMDNVRAHSGAAEGARQPGGGPIRTGVGFGEDADEAADAEATDSVGSSPSEDAVPTPAGRLKSLPQERGLRLFMRAKQLRILSLNSEVQEIELDHGSISSSSLAVASYSLAAEQLTVRLTKVRGTVYLTDPQVRILDVPIFVLPVEDYAYDVDSEPPIRQLEFIQNDRFGFAFRSYIDAVATYDFFMDPEPPFNPLRLGPQIDYYSKRGLGIGVNLDYGSTSAFGNFRRASFRSYYINDPGDDRDRARELGWYPVEKHSRGRIKAGYSQHFGDGWQMDHWLNYSSDQNFRREFFEPEYDNNEIESSYFQIKKRYEGLNFFVRLQPKIHPWESRTEYLPTVGFDAQKIPVGDFGLTMSSHTEASVLRFMPGDRDEREEISTLRADSRTWFSLPFELGPFALDPYAGARFTAATNHIKYAEDGSRPGLSGDGTFAGMRSGDEENDGFLYRVIPFVGVNLQTFITGNFPDVRIPGLGIDGLRHVFAPFVRYRNDLYNSLDDVPGRGFIPMDGVDVLDEFHEIRVGFRNRFQTRTGWGEDRRTVDYFELMAELPLYPQRKRDNDGRFVGDLEVAAVWRPAPGFALAGDMFLDPVSGRLSRASGSFRFDVLSFGSANVYYRLLQGQHQVVGISGDLALSELYRIGFKQEYDLQKGEFRDTRISLTRRILEAVDLGVTFRYDAVDGDFGFFLSISPAFRSPGSSSLLR